MNVYDTANQLAEEIKQSEEYVTYKMAKEAINLNFELKNKIDEFEKARENCNFSKKFIEHFMQDSNLKLAEICRIMIVVLAVVLVLNFLLLINY